MANLGKGRVIFIGAGPGAADLITVRGAVRLALANVVLFDALTDPALREFAPAAQWIDVGKRGFCDSTGQTTINALLVKHASEVDVVVRLDLLGHDEYAGRTVASHTDQAFDLVAPEGHTLRIDD